ncbi:MAG: SPOR domain-containing protein, partial [Pseudomonadota bacterium]
MRQILDKSFARLGRSPSLLRRAYVARPKPRMKPTLLASGETVETPVIATLFTPDLSPKRKQALAILDPQIGALGDRLGAVGGEPGGEDLIGRLIERTDYFHSLTKTLAEVDGDLAQGDAEADQPTAAIAPDARWSVQIGAYNSAELAAQKLRKVAERTGGDIAEAPWAVAPAKRRGSTLFRARFTGFERVDAESHCLRIKSKGFDCFAIKEGSQSNS